MRIVNGRWHENVGFVGGITEHQPLVARALVLRPLAADATINVFRLFANDVDDPAGMPVVADIGTGVANITNDFADEVFQVNPR